MYSTTYFQGSNKSVATVAVGHNHGEDKHQRELSDALNAVRMPFWDAVLGGRD